MVSSNVLPVTTEVFDTVTLGVTQPFFHAVVPRGLTHPAPWKVSPGYAWRTVPHVTSTPDKTVCHLVYVHLPFTSFISNEPS